MLKKQKIWRYKMRQYRGCSRLYIADYIYDQEKNTITFGTPKKFAEAKNISREISSESEEVWADNKLQDTTYGGTAVTRTFGCTRINPEIAADVLGETVITIGEGEKAKKLYGTAPDGSARPYKAFGYALHDGDVEKPCEIIWAFKGIVNSISKAANTIDKGTGSEGQEVNVTFGAPDLPWSKTGKANLDIKEALDSKTVASAYVDNWFKQVVTYDNAETILLGTTT